MVVEIILATLAIAAAGSAVAALRGRRARRPAAPAVSAHRQIADGDLLPGDVVQHLGADYLVEGVVAFAPTDAGKPVLVVAWLTDGSRERQLLVDLEAPPRCALTERRDAGERFGEAPTTLEERGRELRLVRRAALRFRCSGEARGLPSQGACELGVYRGPGQLKAAVASHPAGTVLLVGDAVTEAALTLLPGGSAAGEGEAT
jgi:hypothetical protein